jgi:hypothetical protein
MCGKGVLTIGGNVMGRAHVDTLRRPLTRVAAAMSSTPYFPTASVASIDVPTTTRQRIGGRVVMRVSGKTNLSGGR